VQQVHQSVADQALAALLGPGIGEFDFAQGAEVSGMAYAPWFIAR
jgi:hypothetical protein